MNELGDLLRNLRGEKSLREASEKAGISHNYLSIVEKGTDPRSGAPIKPTPETLKLLSKAYNYPYEELMKKAGYLPEEETSKDDRDPAEKLIEYLEMELTDEEIMERMTFKIDTITLSDEEVKEFIAFVRAKRFMKTGQQTPSTSKEL